MPIRHLSKLGEQKDRLELARQLLEEWVHPNPAAEEPIIVSEGGAEDAPQHIYVVWQAWQDMDQVERSEIIMDAAEEKYGTDAAIRITVAMGLTREEARRMNMAESLGIE